MIIESPVQLINPDLLLNKQNENSKVNSDIGPGLVGAKSQIFSKNEDYYQFEDTMNSLNDNECDNFVINRYSRPNKLTHF